MVDVRLVGSRFGTGPDGGDIHNETLGDQLGCGPLTRLAAGQAS